MNKVALNIWGRQFDLEVEYDCFKNEEILPSQKSALAAFCNAQDAIVISEKLVEKYCVENNAEEIDATSIDNIFKYVIPRYLYVARSKQKHIVAIMCDYRFDMENGLAVVFENEKPVKVGVQDIIL
ncbi:MAG: hypothetical protein LUD12_06990 [Lachnospiraceae bacterium]|nr:hypothetical protein [Lachnospiraceae bacterium]